MGGGTPLCWFKIGRVIVCFLPQSRQDNDTGRSAVNLEGNIVKGLGMTSPSPLIYLPLAWGEQLKHKSYYEWPHEYSSWDGLRQLPITSCLQGSSKCQIPANLWGMPGSYEMHNWYKWANHILIRWVLPPVNHKTHEMSSLGEAPQKLLLYD